MKEKILFIDSETPGYFFPLLVNIGNFFKDKGHDIAIAIPSKLKYIRFKDYIEDEDIYIFDSKLNNTNTRYEYESWDIHASVIRQQKLLGKVLINDELYRSYLTFFEDIFSQYQPTTIISENVSNAFFMAAYRTAKKRQVLYLQMQSGRLSNSINFYKDLSYRPIYNVKNSKRNNYFSPDYMNSQGSKIKLRELSQYFKSNFVKSPELGFVLWFRIKYLLWLFRRAIRKQWYLVKYRKQGMDNFEKGCVAKKAYLFPLHFRPEASTLVQAQYYQNDIDLIRNISFSLTNDEILIVKEHPNALGVRGKSFFTEIEGYPNVKVVRHDLSLERIFDKIDVCFTLTSTVGYEALLREIPVILLGEVFYSDYPGVISLDSIDNLRSAIEKANTIRKKDKIDSKKISEIYSKACFPGRMDYRSEEILSQRNTIEVGNSILEILANERK